MSKTTNRFFSEVRSRAVRMVLDHEGQHRSRRAAVAHGVEPACKVLPIIPLA